MKRALVLLALVPVGASSAVAADRGIAIHGKLFEPERLTVVAGDTVTWTNHDAVTHDIAADDGSFASGALAPGESVSVTFSRPGRVHYLCTIHRYMRGEIDVFALSLSGPARPVPVGGRVVLRGLAPPGTGAVTIERREADGRWTPVARTDPDDTGAYRAELVATEPAVVRAVAGTLESAPVRLAVSARLDVVVRMRRGDVLVAVSAMPAQPGAPVAVQLYARERFAWAPAAHGRLNARSRARFALHLRRAHHLRAVLLAGSGGYAPATSPTVVVGP